MPRPRALLFPLLVFAASCSSPPSPPSVDGRSRRPANTATAVELQQCAAALHDASTRALQAGRLAEQSLASLMETVMQGQHAPPRTLAAGNRIFTLRFAFGSSQLVIAPVLDAQLVKEALTAELVLLRGRTDGRTDSAGESRVARDRALAVRDHLVAAGVAPAKLRTTYQPTGDHVADNSTASGRALNRRVEIEIYPAAPVAAARLTSLTTGTPLAPAEPWEVP